MTDIRFYATTDPYGCLSNFARFPIELDGQVWATSEHYFQAQKFLTVVDRDAVASAPTPFDAARIGRERNRSFRSDWTVVRDSIMRDALRAKFTQHSEPREILLSTGNARLVEHTKNDQYWADGGDGTGQNRLGELLMELRTHLQPEAGEFLVPPWVYRPDIEVSDMFWRMGSGEDYIVRLAEWLETLSQPARTEYERYYPAPPSWRDSI